MLGLQVNLDRIYAESDPAYFVWLRAVLDEVEEWKSRLYEDAL